MARRDGDGWVLCDCGRPHWGVFGAAGVLIVRIDAEQPLVLLQLRAGWTHGGGTWGVPGGALDSHEDSVTAAMREAWEEAGIEPDRLAIRAIFSDDHGTWRYDTVIAHVEGDAGAHAANAEADEVRWVPLPEVDRLLLHPGFAASWPALRHHVAATLGAEA